MNAVRPLNPLRARRAGLGLSQADVAVWMKKSQSWYSLIENGDYEPSAEEMALLARFLSCSVSDIFPEKAA